MVTSDLRKDKELMKNYVFSGEDHTLGAMLTFVLDKMQETDFCAYTIRHPTENVLYLRLKVKKGYNVDAVFRTAVVELLRTLGVIETKFIQSIQEFQEVRGN